MTSKIQINEETASVGTLNTNSTELIRIGDAGTSNSFAIKEVIFRNTLDDSAAQLLVVNYLNSKYSIY